MNSKENKYEMIHVLPVSHREPIKPSRHLQFSESGSQNPPFSQTILLQSVITKA